MNKENKNMIWYASYGSNMSRDRFKLYLEGGKHPYSNKDYFKCRDPYPKKECQIIIPYELYFSKKSSNWCNGAVAFIESQKRDVNTYGKAYLISEEQFLHILIQENGKNPKNTNLTLDFNSILSQEQSFVNGKGFIWYGRIINLGTKEGYPV